jgi:hypothetical protein
MKISDETIFVLLAIIVIASLASVFFQPRHAIVKYDCRLAEISPDYPQEVKQKCRDLTMQGNR